MMKKWMALLCAALLSLCGTVTATAETAQSTGGWAAVEDHALTEDQLALFDKAIGGAADGEYTPMFLLSTQVVAGMNYRFLCRGVAEDGKSFFATVTVYADLNGNAEVLDASEIDVQSAADENTQNLVMNYIGFYQDQVSERATMTLEAENETGAAIEINWADSAFEGYTWRLHGSLVQADDVVVILYRDGEMLAHTANDQDEVSYSTQYADGEGALLIKADGSILWKDLKEDAGAECSFVWSVQE